MKASQGYSRKHSAPSHLIGGTIKEALKKCRQANPITYVSKAPPCFIVHGDKDFAIPMNQIGLLHVALQKAGASSTLHVVKGGGHGFSKSTPANDEIVKKVMNFFDDQLKTASKMTKPPS